MRCVEEPSSESTARLPDDAALVAAGPDLSALGSMRHTVNRGRGPYSSLSATIGSILVAR